MSNLEQSIGMLSRMYEIRKDVKKLLTSSYGERVGKFKDLVRTTMVTHKKNEVQAILIVCKVPEIASNEIARLLTVCAALEISEESPNLKVQPAENSENDKKIFPKNDKKYS